MRCVLCEKLSFFIICRSCQDNYLDIKIEKRELEKDFFVYSFYGYDEVKELLNAKYSLFGDKVFEILAKLSFEKFSQVYKSKNDELIYAIPIDDNIRHSFSQSAILAKHLKSKHIKPLYNILVATNIVKYAGKNLEFRLKNKRKFKINHQKLLKNKSVILIDDLVTTGLTILEAKNKLKSIKCNVLFAMTLSDAKRVN